MLGRSNRRRCKAEHCSLTPGLDVFYARSSVRIQWMALAEWTGCGRTHD